MFRVHTLTIVASFAALSACGGPETQVRVDCGATDIILTEDQARTILEASALTDTSSREFAVAACDLFKDFDSSALQEPTAVRVILPSGAELNGIVQASQQ